MFPAISASVTTRSILRKFIQLLTLSVALAFGVNVASAQTPGSADPLWQNPYQPPAPSGQLGWYDTDTQPNGQLVVVGKTELDWFVWRYADNGALDASFGVGGAALLPARGTTQVTVDGLGRIYAWSTNVDQLSRVVIRLLPNGTVDTSFGSGGVVTVDSAVTRQMELTLLSDGKVLLTGQPFGSPSVFVARKLLANGGIDTSFGVNGDLELMNLANANVVERPSVVATHDGGFVIGYTDTAGTAYARKWSATGSPDSSFGTAGVVSAQGVSVRMLEPLVDGKLLISLARPSGGTFQYYLARLLPSGGLDTTFGNGGYAPFEGQSGIAVDASGGIVIAGAIAPMRRLTSSGAPDNSFVGAPGSDVNYSDLEVGNGIYGLLIQTHPNILTSRTLYKFVMTTPPTRGSLSTGAASGSSFRVVVEDHRGVPVVSANTAHAVGIQGYIYPHSSDLNASADLFVVVRTSRGFFMRNASGAFVAWNGQVSSLVPAYEDVPLTNALHVPVYSGQLPFADTYQIYIGYRRSEGGPLVYMGLPTMLSVMQ